MSGHVVPSSRWAAIRVENLQKVFTTIRNERVHALEDINVEVRNEEFVTIVGPSGCGKSTLLRILAGLTPATSGCVSLDGTPISGPRPDVGIAFQNPILLPWRTLDNVLLPAEVKRVPAARARERAIALLQRGL
jgi:NitT/TauT family transport system ATP-binding protein